MDNLKIVNLNQNKPENIFYIFPISLILCLIPTLFLDLITSSFFDIFFELKTPTLLSMALYIICLILSVYLSLDILFTSKEYNESLVKVKNDLLENNFKIQEDGYRLIHTERIFNVLYNEEKNTFDIKEVK